PVRDSDRGRFWGRRPAATTSLSIALAFLGGVVVDVWKNYVPDKAALGYSCLFVLSGLIGLYGVFLLSITPEPPMPAVPKHSHPLGSFLLHSEIEIFDGSSCFWRFGTFLSIWRLPFSPCTCSRPWAIPLPRSWFSPASAS